MSSTNIQYIRDLSGNVVAESSGGTWSAGYVYLGGTLLAEYAGGTTYFAHDDHLGSTRLLTGYPTPSVVECDDYYPYGERISCGSSVTSHKFTGYERDSESNLDNANARYYGSTLGRFMSPDPAGNAVADPTNPQSWNMYAYVNNNPLAVTDPTGLCGDDGTPCGCTDNAACEPYCGGACGDIGPPEQFPAWPVVTYAPWYVPPPTTLPLGGIFATGPGFDYSWMGILQWAGILSPPCAPLWGLASPCIMSNGPTGIWQMSQDTACLPEGAQGPCQPDQWDVYMECNHDALGEAGGLMSERSIYSTALGALAGWLRKQGVAGAALGVVLNEVAGGMVYREHLDVCMADQHYPIPDAPF